MVLPILLLAGAIGGGAYLYKNPQAREAAKDLANDVIDVMPPKYANLASKVGLGRSRSPDPSAQSQSTVSEGQYTTPPYTNDPPPTAGGI